MGNGYYLRKNGKERPIEAVTSGKRGSKGFPRKKIIKKGDVEEYISSLRHSERPGDQVLSTIILPAKPPEFGEPDKPLPPWIRKFLENSGIDRLYSHQVKALNHIRSGEHVVVSTATASGKSMIYNIPVFENILEHPKAAALYLFPLKALAQDQYRNFRSSADACGLHRATAAIYDGDTPRHQRSIIRTAPPNVLLTNPEMLHLSLLPYHTGWSGFYRNLKIVVVDEVHIYRGILGSHMAQVFRRLIRICGRYGVSPTFIFTSATVGNPEKLAEQLTGLSVRTVTESGAPRSRQHMIFMSPESSPASTAVLLVKAAIPRTLRTIVYTKSRKMAELIAMWAGGKNRAATRLISAYRSGFLPEERRDIEKRLANGDLLAVISTSALELGIDIGDLDLCILVGYPGSIISTRQRGGRVGRSGRNSAIILIAGDDALDRYFMNNPKELIDREPEAAVANPENPDILKKHIPCAAAEMPIHKDDPILSGVIVKKILSELKDSGSVVFNVRDDKWYAASRFPHRDIDLRGAGERFVITCADTGRNLGEIDGFRAFRETHPGAIYIHGGTSYVVKTLSPETKTVKVLRKTAGYYTRVLSEGSTEILDTQEEKTTFGITAQRGRIRVTDWITAYEKWNIRGKQKIDTIPIDLPPLIFETEGLWFLIPDNIKGKVETMDFDFMGSIHAAEHAVIGIFPLLVMADRNDLGGFSTNFHPQTKSASIFVYDGVPGGAGLTREAFRKAGQLLELTEKTISGCDCARGCPSCVHSPKCGSGNDPIDKSGALLLLMEITKGKKLVITDLGDFGGAGVPPAHHK